MLYDKVTARLDSGVNEVYIPASKEFIHRLIKKYEVINFIDKTLIYILNLFLF